MGIIYGLLGAGSFALSTVFIRRGQRMYRHDDGAVITGLINVVMLGIASLIVMTRQTVGWNGQGVAALVLAGVLTTGLGRLASMAAVRALGPSRATLFKVSAPLFTVAAAYFLLQERLRLLEAAGAAVVLAGLWLLVREQQEQGEEETVLDGAGEGSSPGEEAAAGSVVAAPASAVAAPVSAAAVKAVATEAVTTKSAAARAVASRIGLPEGAVFGLLAAMLFGTGFVARKVGLTWMPFPIVGAFIGAGSGVATSFGTAWAKRGWQRAVNTAIRGVPVWFLLAGVAGCIALIGQFSALAHLPATMVSVFFATEPLWALAFGIVLFPGQETVTARIVWASAIIIAGVILIVLG